MQFMPSQDQTGPHTLVLAREDLKIVSEPPPIAHEDHASADRQHAAPANAAAQLDPRIASFRPAALDDIGRLGGPVRPSRPVVRGAVGFALGGCIVLAAIAWQSSYGVAARRLIGPWAPQLASTSSPPPADVAAVDQPNSPGTDVAGAQAASPSPQPPATAQDTAQQAAPLAASAAPVPEQAAAPAPAEQAAAPAPADQAQLLATMTRNVARLEQEIEGLKAGQAQMARDHAATAEQLKAAQEQMARLNSKASEQHLAKMPAPRRPTAAPAAAPIRKPVPVLPSPQAHSQAPTQPQAMAQGQETMARPLPEQRAPLGLRPPMPVP